MFAVAFFVLGFVFGGLFLAVIGFPVLVVRVRDDPRRCVRGRLTYLCMLVGYFAGGIGGFILECQYLGSRIALNPLTGLLLGAVIGNVIGRGLVIYTLRGEE